MLHCCSAAVHTARLLQCCRAAYYNAAAAVLQSSNSTRYAGRGTQLYPLLPTAAPRTLPTHLETRPAPSTHPINPPHECPTSHPPKKGNSTTTRPACNRPHVTRSLTFSTAPLLRSQGISSQAPESRSRRHQCTCRDLGSADGIRPCHSTLGLHSGSCHSTRISSAVASSAIQECRGRQCHTIVNK